jgi:two-component system cell cycle sensor histidine kinase/response regulator CckA
MPANDDSFPRLLVVDDNPMLLQTLAVGFRACGFEVVTASHGIDALMQFQAHAGDFAAILTDTDMPKMNGPTLVKNLRALDYRGRILVMSGRMSVSDAREYQDLQVSGFLSKPFEVSMVSTMLLQTD